MNEVLQSKNAIVVCWERRQRNSLGLFVKHDYQCLDLVTSGLRQCAKDIDRNRLLKIRSSIGRGFVSAM